MHSLAPAVLNTWTHDQYILDKIFCVTLPYDRYVSHKPTSGISTTSNTPPATCLMTSNSALTFLNPLKVGKLKTKEKDIFI